MSKLPNVARAAHQSFDMLTADIRHEIAETVYVDDRALEFALALANLAARLEPYHRLELGSERLKPYPPPQPCRGRREDVSPMKGRANLLEPIAWRAKLHDTLDTRRLAGGPQKTVIWSDEAGAGAALDRNREPLRANPGVHHHEKDRFLWKKSPTLRQRNRTRRDRLRRNSVC